MPLGVLGGQPESFTNASPRSPTSSQAGSSHLQGSVGAREHYSECFKGLTTKDSSVGMVWSLAAVVGRRAARGVVGLRPWGSGLKAASHSWARELPAAFAPCLTGTE